MNKKTSNIILLLSAIIPFGLQFSGIKSELGNGSMIYSIMWAIVNYLFMMTAVDFISKYKEILKLEDLDIRKRTYNLNIFVYIGFLVFVNIYFFQQMYMRDNKIIKLLANPLFLIGLFLLFLYNLQNGKFPIREDKDTVIYNIPLKSSFRDGRDKLGTVVGSYGKGLVIGNNHFPYEDMKSISKSKDNEIVIKGKEGSKNYIVNIGSLNSANQAIIEINKALNNGKIDEKKINLKKIKNF